MPFSFEALDSADFEFLAKDIAERESGKKLTCYAAGPDGGIDADDFYKDAKGSPSVILQAKHWQKTNNPGRLTENLENDFFKKISTRGYDNPRIMIFTSMELTNAAQTRIKTIGNNSGFSHVDVFDKVKISELLKEPNCQDIIRKHFKLWIAHTEVLNQLFNQDQFIDCDQFLFDAESQKNLFVQTGLYDQAHSCLENERLVLIAGDPGTGKTMMTRMLALASAADGYIIRYSSENDPQRIKQVISADADLKEMIILDDFLGQRTLDASTSRLNSIISLVSYIQRTKSKRIILNSRFTILNEAKNSSDEFMKMIERINESITVINSNRLSKLDKARILLSNLRHGQVPDQHISSVAFGSTSSRAAWEDGGRPRNNLTDASRLLKIVMHNNYNPRIVEYVCRKEAYSRVTPDSYFELIQNYLNDPKEIWKDEFDNRMRREDRYVMYILFSLTDTDISLEALRRAFQELACSDTNLDLSRNIFESAIARLAGSLLRRTFIKDGVNCSVINPSVNDYIASFLREADVQVARMIENAAYADQITKLAKLNDSAMVSNMVKSVVSKGDMSVLPALKSPTCVQVLEITNSLNILDDSVSPDIVSAFKVLERNFSHEDSASIFVRRIKENDDFLQMPGLKEFFSANSEFESLTCNSSLDAALIRGCYELALRYACTVEEKKELQALEYHVVCRELASSANVWVSELIESISFDAEEFMDIDGVMRVELEDAYQDIVDKDFFEWRKRVSVSFGEGVLDFLPENELKRIYDDSAYDVIDSIDHERLLGVDSVSGRSLGSENRVEGDVQQIVNLFKEYMDT
ncbi:nSTAND3 domain-containing NTPase [Actinomyces oris]|jgi:hypothetical protein